MNALTRLVLMAAVLELVCGVVGFGAAGSTGAAAALIGASIATAAQIVAVALLRPAMNAGTPQFQQRWVLGMAVRFGSFLVLAVVMVTLKHALPPLWMAIGYIGTMLTLLFAETRFLR